jgi:hypothetical protein
MSEPRPPSSVPKYLAEGIPKQDNPTLREIQSWIDELLEARKLEPEEIEVDEGEEVVDVENHGDGCIVTKMVNCGKDSCGKCPGEGHGPYSYRVTSQDGNQKWEYLGKADS